MSVIIGSARHDERGNYYKGGVAGDSLQKSVPDFDGEVSMQKMYNHTRGWYILRLKDSQAAARAGSYMAQACNNANIGYDQNNRFAILTDGINSPVHTECDCSTLVRACVKAATGTDPGNFTTANEVDVLVGSGLVVGPIAYQYESQLCVGDILVTRTQGHTAIVVQADGQGDAAIYGGVVTVEGTTTLPSGEVLYSEIDFESRLEAPKLTGNRKGKKNGKPYDERDIWYINKEDDGLNPFGHLDTVSYVWCRFSEIGDPEPHNPKATHEPCRLSWGSPSAIYRTDEDGYTRNVACALGAVMCFYNKKRPSDGFVCIVEQMNSGGEIVTSEWGRHGFTLTTRKKRYGSWDFDDYVFQGFVHNPAVGMNAVAESALETFCRIAEEHVGDDSTWATTQMDVVGTSGWSAAFVTACSKSAGSSLNIVIPNTTSVSAIGRIGILRNMGEWIDGPCNSGVVQPEPGDIAIIRNTSTPEMAPQQGDVAAIVVRVNGNSMDVVFGEGSRVQLQTYFTNLPKLAGVFRPFWEQVDGTTESVKLYRDLGALYTNGVTRFDACAREVGYVSSTYQPSILRSKIRLSAVNYTGLLANMYSVFAQSSTSDAAKSELIVDLWTNTVKSWYQDETMQFKSASASVLSETDAIAAMSGNIPVVSINATASAKVAYQFLTSAGLSPAATCGILGNIQAESGFNTAAVGDKGTSFGICQWHNARGTRMKQFVGANWAVNLTGQLQFLLTELTPAKYFSSIRDVPNTETGARTAADVFVRKFEVPANVDSESIKRQSNAVAFWKELVS